ncbi:uncharacterized protein [Battus philenor]|uniref:uncharacterized protein n=1 Tax=Battus philenor TaxID=42288 RepID=UPI0035D05565
MESQNQENISDEDIPSDFFDDFSKDEFIEGLSVIDSWEVKEGAPKRNSRSRIAAAVDGVRDLRELIRDGRDGSEMQYEKNESGCRTSRPERYSSYERLSSNSRRERSSSRIDNYIKPGSRRDLRKTNEAIKRDKEVKVKEYLSKHLDSIEDLKPPGTELDDFLNEPSSSTKRRYKSRSPDMMYERHNEYKYRKSPRREYIPRERRSIHRSPHHNYYESHRKNKHYSPQRNYHHHSPSWKQRRHYGPVYSPRRNSRSKYSSPQHSKGYSRSPVKYSYIKKQRTLERKDTFLYPNEICQTVSESSPNTVAYQTGQQEFYANTSLPEYSGGLPEYSYTQDNYPHGSCDSDSKLGSGPIMNSAPTMVPPPAESTSTISQVPVNVTTQRSQDKPYDALAKLVVDGTLSKEDYLKLRPNKGVYMDNAVSTHITVKVLDRCVEALTKLNKLELPNRLLINNKLLGQETKSLTPKYCSPLKRQASVDFYFTNTNGKFETVSQNRQVIESIISTIGLSDVVSQSKQKDYRNMKDAAVQTTKPFCDVCHIRDSTKTNEVGTAIEREHFTSTVHTQVVDQDLINSKTVFNPSGSVPQSEPISIAHLTPAQLVSQLAACAKTLKQSQPMQQPQYSRRNTGNYSYSGKGSQEESFYKYPYH